MLTDSQDGGMGVGGGCLMIGHHEFKQRVVHETDEVRQSVRMMSRNLILSGEFISLQFL